MKILFVLLLFVSVLSLLVSVMIIFEKQRLLRILKGTQNNSVGSRIKWMLSYLKSKVLKFNKVFEGVEGYKKNKFYITKIDMTEKISGEYFVFLQEASVLIVFVMAFTIFENFGISIVAGMAAFFIPVVVLNAKVKQKEIKLLRNIPDAFDIISANIEGGLSLVKAVERYALKNDDVFARELIYVINSMKLGKSFSDSLEGMASKLKMQDIDGFVRTFSRAEKTGGNVRALIKAQGEEIRDKSFQRMKKKAYEAPVKLLIPLLLFVFPVIFIVLFGPIIIKFTQGF